jgi:hypothetical protein
VLIPATIRWTESHGDDDRGRLRERVLRPLENLKFPNLQHVFATISSAPATADDVAGYFEPEEWEAASTMTSA